MASRTSLGLVGVVVALAAPLSSAAPSPTPDERLVAELQTVVEAAGSARRALSSGREPAAASDPLRRALAALESARVVAPRAVGALENRSMRAALRQGRTLVRGASADVSRGRAAAAAAKLAQTLTLARVALREFGRPLRREFVATAVHRSFPNIPAYRDYSGVTASTSEEVVEIVIGRATRATANAGEGARAVPAAPGLPVTELSAYQIQDPIGRYTTNWCALDAGLITCPLRPTLTRDHLFTLAFAPKLPRGMQVLVRFRAASGRSSYSVYTAR